MSFKEQPRHIGLQEPVAIVRETRGVECRAIDLQVQKEAKQHVVAKPLAELALTADAVQAHQQASFQQMLRRN